MNKKPSSCLRIFGFLGLGVLCLAAVGAIWAADSIPRAVERDFGAPGEGVSGFQSLTLGLQLLSVRQQVLEPTNPNGGKQDFIIEKNQPVNTIAMNLEKSGLVRSASAFRLFLVYSGLDTGIQAGEYVLSPAQNTIQIARALQDATPSVVSFRILPGWRMEEIAAALPTSGLKVTGQQFLSEAMKPSIQNTPPSLQNLKAWEGFFFPDVYRFSREVTAQEMVATFLKRFDEKVSPELKTGFQRQGLSLSQAVVLASIIQREAMVVEEQPMIASVFFNRLKVNMKLESDPTTQYAVGYNAAQKTWWTNPLSAANLRINSPYNTYVVAGLPPGAISNPGLEALQAVAFPAQSPYFYFRAKCDGSGKHNFSVTYEEHLKNGCP